MAGAATFFSIVTALVMIGSGAYDFTGPRKVLDLMAQLGRYPGFERTLGIIKILGGLGLLIGLAIKPIGVLAALGLVVYFVLAVRAHSKLGHPGSESVPAAALFMLSALTLVTVLFS